MPCCDLHLEFGREEPAYQPGEPITGIVVIDVREDCTCTALWLSPIWRIERLRRLSCMPCSVCAGGALLEEAGREALKPEGGRWRAGQRLRIPFQLSAPAGPLSYAGQIFSVRWGLRVRAELDRAPAAVVEARFTLRGGPWQGGGSYRQAPAEIQVYLGPAAEARVTRRSKSLTTAGRAALGVGLGALGALALSTGDPAAHGLAGTIALVSLVMGAASILRRPIHRRLGRPVLQAPSSAAPGETLSITVSLPRRQAWLVREASASLLCEERVHLDTHVLHTAEQELAPSTTDGAEDRAVWTAHLVVPPGAAPTFGAGRHEVRWTLRVDVELGDVYLWRREQILTVRPANGHPPAAGPP